MDILESIVYFNINARNFQSIIISESILAKLYLSLSAVNMQVEASSSPLLTVDEVEKIQRKKIASDVVYVFRLTYAAMFDRLIHEEKLNRCNGCVIHHPSQREHSCLTMDTEDAWFYYHDEVREKIDLNVVLKTAESVCSVVGLKLSSSWETYVTELPKFPWTSMYLASLEFEDFGEKVQAEQLQDRILYAVYYGPNGLKTNDFNGMEVRKDRNTDEVMNVDPIECPENVARKEEKLMDLDVIINYIQNKLCI